MSAISGKKGIGKKADVMGKTTWLPWQDQMVLRGFAAGKSGHQISMTVGKSRNAVIARHNRLRGIQFPSYLARKRCQTMAREENIQKRVRQSAQTRALVYRLDTAGASLNDIIQKVREAKMPLQGVAEYFGISHQAVYQRVKKINGDTVQTGDTNSGPDLKDH